MWDVIRFAVIHLLGRQWDVEGTETKRCLGMSESQDKVTDFTALRFYGKLDAALISWTCRSNMALFAGAAN
jgi:hypothetical protein